MNNPLVIVDGAHNPESIHALVNDVQFIAQDKEVYIVIATFKDKNVETMLSELNFLSPHITLTTFNHVRARDEMDYFVYLDEYQFKEDHTTFIQTLINSVQDGIILVTGSLAFAYLVCQEFDSNIYQEPIKHDEDNV